MVLGTVIVVAMLLVAAYAVYFNPRTIDGFKSGTLKTPELTTADQPPGIPPTPGTLVSQTYSYTLDWEMAPVYVFYGGMMRVSLDNNGASDIYVYRLAFRWLDYGGTYAKNTAVLIPSGQQVSLGVLPFKGPNATGDYHYCLELKVAASTLTHSAWYDFGRVTMAPRIASVENGTKTIDYTVEHNPLSCYDRFNRLVDYSQTAGEVSVIREKYPGNYSLLQVLEAYEWTYANVQYQDDPQDYWQSANETMARRTGDCEDFAVLMASFIGELGGNAQLNLIDGHAFATVLVTTSASELPLVQVAVDSFYGTHDDSVRLTYLHDGSGYWLVVDPTGTPYAGGLPSLAAPVKGLETRGEWSFTESTWLITVDATGDPTGSWLPWF